MYEKDDFIIDNKYEEKLKETLISEISKRNDCQIKCQKSFNTMWLKNDSWDVEFRYVIFMDKIIVSRICFKNKHQGCMTACFEILKSFAKKLNYHTIEIQSVETYEMQQWCKKNGFNPSCYALAITDEKGREVIVGDYNLTLKDE